MFARTAAAAAAAAAAALLVLAVAAPALADTTISDAPLARYDYSIEVTRTGLNKLFVIFSQMVLKRQALTSGPLEKLSVAMEPDRTVIVDGVSTLSGLGRIHFRIKGGLYLTAANRFDFLIDDLKVSDADSNIVRTLSLQVAKAVVVQFLNVFIRSKEVTDYCEVEMQGFIPVIGSIATLFGKKRCFRFILKPDAFPSKVMQGLDTVHASASGERLLIQGVIGEEN